MRSKKEQKCYIRREEPTLAGEYGDGDIVIGRDIVHVHGDVEPILRGHRIEFTRLVELDDGNIALLLERDAVCHVCLSDRFSLALSDLCPMRFFSQN